MISFLIDEDLSRELATEVQTRGYQCLSVQNMVRLRGKDDGAIARFVIANNMILVTRNMVDHEATFRKIECHPGVIFFVVEHPKLYERKYHKMMINSAIDNINLQGREPVQEALLVRAAGKPGAVDITVDRYYLPKLDA
jgi:predicted nuclease of predicted toxin-antitoxin system